MDSRHWREFTSLYVLITPDTTPWTPYPEGSCRNTSLETNWKVSTPNRTLGCPQVSLPFTRRGSVPPRFSSTPSSFRWNSFVPTKTSTPQSSVRHQKWLVKRRGSTRRVLIHHRDPGSFSPCFHFLPFLSWFPFNFRRSVIPESTVSGLSLMSTVAPYRVPVLFILGPSLLVCQNYQSLTKVGRKLSGGHWGNGDLVVGKRWVDCHPVNDEWTSVRPWGLKLKIKDQMD